MQHLSKHPTQGCPLCFKKLPTYNGIIKAISILLKIQNFTKGKLFLCHLGSISIFPERA